MIDPKPSSRTPTSSSLGVEREVMANTTFGVRYVYRNIGRVLEDVANCPMVAYELGIRRHCGSVEYILTNPSSEHADPRPDAAVPRRDVRRPGAQVPRARVHAEPPRRELVGDGVVPLVAAARQLRGLLPRRQRPVGSGHLVALRLPDQRSELHAIGGPQLATRRHPLPRRPNGILPLDRPHQVKLFGNYLFDMGPEPRRGPQPRAPASR